MRIKRLAPNVYCLLPILSSALLIQGCTKHDAPVDNPMQPALRRAAFEETIGRSCEGHPIILDRWNTGRLDVLILAAIHGDESTTRDIALHLIDQLNQDSWQLGSNAVAIIPCLNPDGLEQHRRTNSAGVDLNRNFPANNWKLGQPGGSTFGGPTPGSEPETAALMQVIQELRPRVIVSIHSMTDPCDNYDGPAEPIARRMSQYNKYPIRASIGYPTPGSLGSWAGIDQQIPVITLELPRAQKPDAAWEQNRTALLDLVIGRATSQ